MSRIIDWLSNAPEAPTTGLQIFWADLHLRVLIAAGEAHRASCQGFMAFLKQVMARWLELSLLPHPKSLVSSDFKFDHAEELAFSSRLAAFTASSFSSSVSSKWLTKALKE